MKRTLILFILITSSKLFSRESIHMDKWKHPLIFGSKPIIFAKRLYIYDPMDNKIKVYDVTKSYYDPEFLWETPETF